jgi:hypothetical protein
MANPISTSSDTPQNTNNTISKNVKRMLGLDLHGWEAVVVWSLGIAAVAAIAVVISTRVVIILQRDALNDSAEKIALATEGAATANARAAEANERAVKAELKLENLRKQVGPRNFDRDKSVKALQGKPTANAEILYLGDDHDSYNLAIHISAILERANWKVELPKPIPLSLDSDRKQFGGLFAQAFALMSLGAQPWSVSIVTRSGCVVGGQEPCNALMDAIMVNSDLALSGFGHDAKMSEGKVRVVVGPRYQ